jgi:predicted HicB family RNase H-like nuclease
LVVMAKDKATLNVNPDLHRELKVEAAKRGVKISDLAEQLLREGLKKTR